MIGLTKYISTEHPKKIAAVAVSAYYHINKINKWMFNEHMETGISSVSEDYSHEEVEKCFMHDFNVKFWQHILLKPLCT